MCQHRGQYLLTLKDIFSKWFEAIPLSSTTGNKVLRTLQMLYARFGHPLQVHTDNGTYFKSQVMQEAFRLFLHASRFLLP